MHNWKALWMATATLLLSACDGGSDGGSDGSSTATAYTIGGTVSGLASGNSVVLQNNGGDDLAVDANGSFTFATALANGSDYAITVATVPTGQACSVTGGSGTVNGADITGIAVACTPVAPTLILTPTAPKTFRFTWSDAAGETEYRLLENPDGVSGYSQVATLSAGATTYDHAVLLPARINARYMLQACNANGCSNSSEVAVSGNLDGAVGYFKASNGSYTGQFGYTAALSGDGTTLAVGAPKEGSNAIGVNCGGNLDDGNGNGIPDCQEDASASDSGAVYLFARDDSGTWIQQAYIKASNSDAGDQFGKSIALSDDGDILAVGALMEDSNATGINGTQADNSASFSGAVYLFTRDGAGNWSQQAYVKGLNTEGGDFFGASLALSGDGATLAVRALEKSAQSGVKQGSDMPADPTTDDDSAFGAGAIYVFTLDGSGNWGQRAYIKASNAEGGDNFGWALALSGNGDTLAASAIDEASGTTGVKQDGDMPDDPASDDDSADMSGAVYLFSRDDAGTWSQQAYIKASNTDTLDQFGWSTALTGDGTSLAVGAIYEDSTARGINCGGNLVDDDANGIPDCQENDDGTADDSGAVYFFSCDRAGNWSQQAYMKGSNTGMKDEFGHGIALSDDGNRLAASALKEASNATGINGDRNTNNAGGSGAAYLFVRDPGNAWSQRAYIKAPNTDASDNFGSAVALSSDGNTLAVGSWLEDSNATGIGGDQSNNDAGDSGAVYLY